MVELLQPPLYLIVPDKVEKKVYSGVVTLSSGGTAVTCARAGVSRPMVKELTDRGLLVLLALSVTLMVQLSYVPSSNTLELSGFVRMTVLSPDVAADEDKLPQAPP